jgi:beta-glucosidase
VTLTTLPRTTAPPAEPVGTLRFPPGFSWGVSTAAYQIEGSTDVDGRGPSIWDTFSRAVARVFGGDTGDIACDHYRRYPQDVALLAQLGIPAYRFSLAWPRIQPSGRGGPNPAGLDFYDRLVDELLRHGVEPVVTLYHWDLPQALQDDGGWAQRDTAHRLADYAQLAAERLGDRIRRWTTMNEPWCAAFLGYARGDHAPGHRDPRQALRAVHHLLLGHGLALQRLREVLPGTLSGMPGDLLPGGRAGGHELSVVIDPAAVRPASDSDADLAAARTVDGIANRIFLGPLLRGRYPDDVVRATRAAGLCDWSHVRPGDLEVISAPVDALGVSYCTPLVVEAGEPPAWQAEALLAYPGCPGVRLVERPVPRTGPGRTLDAGALTDLLQRVHREGGGRIPLLVTENAAAHPDRAGADGTHPAGPYPSRHHPTRPHPSRTADLDRIRYLNDQLTAVHAAIGRGVDVRGYYLWSFLDNFAWTRGHAERSGLVHVDHRTQVRTPKRSATWYREVIRRHGVPADAVS